MTNDNISNEELLFDIKNTESEMNAYNLLSEGFYILSRLPEESNPQTMMRQSDNYSDLHSQCKKLLEHLIWLKVERGI